MGRPLADIDEEEVSRLAFTGASNRDIAVLVGVDEGTIRGRFSAIVHKQRALRRLALHQAQFREAEAGNPTMLIWLGKQVLGQEDRTRVKLKAQVKQLEWTDDANGRTDEDPDAAPPRGAIGGPEESGSV